MSCADVPGTVPKVPVPVSPLGSVVADTPGTEHCGGGVPVGVALAVAVAVAVAVGVAVDVAVAVGVGVEVIWQEALPDRV